MYPLKSQHHHMLSHLLLHFLYTQIKIYTWHVTLCIPCQIELNLVTYYWTLITIIYSKTIIDFIHQSFSLAIGYLHCKLLDFCLFLSCNRSSTEINFIFDQLLSYIFTDQSKFLLKISLINRIGLITKYILN